MKFFIVIAVAVLLELSAGLSQAAEFRTVRILTGEDNSFVQKTAISLSDALKQADPGLDVEIATATNSIGSSDAETGKRLYVLIGERAFNSADTGDAPVLAIVPQRVATAGRKRTLISVIYFEQPLARLLNLATLLLRGHDRQLPVIGVVVSPETQPFLVPAETLARNRKLGLHIETAQSEADVGRAIAEAVEDSSILIAIPDSIVHTSNTVQSVLLLSYHAGVPVVGYSAAYLRAGAAVALYSTPEQLAQQAAEVIANYRGSKNQTAPQWPRRFTVGINSTVVRSLGMNVPAGDVLEKNLETMKE